MAQVTICDRCGEQVGADPGMLLQIEDTTRGNQGERELCGDCSEDYSEWFNKYHRLRTSA